MYRAKFSCVLLGSALALVLAGGCPPEAVLNGLTETLVGDDATTGDVDTAPVTTPAGETGTNPADPQTTETDPKTEQAFQDLAGPVTGDAALFDPAAAAPPDLTADEAATITAALAADVVSEASIAADVQVPQVTARAGIVAALGRLGALFTETGPTPENPDQVGTFEGVWLTRDGTPAGTIAGSYDEFPAEQLPPGFTRGGTFAGQYFDSAGLFQGVILGRWGQTGEGRAFFRGQWRDDSDELLGVLKGLWQFDPQRGGGVFFGRWAAFNLCDEVDTLPEYTFEAVDTGGLAATDEAVGDERDNDASSTPVLSEPDVVLTDAALCLDVSKPYGFIRGAYRPFDRSFTADPNQPVDPNFDGFVRCLWRDQDGSVRGALIGRWEQLEPAPTAQDRAVLGRFYGKYVDESGNFIGFVRGSYGRSYHGLGVFRGEYFDENGVTLGWLVGRWRIGVDRPGGPVFGLWNSTLSQ